MGMETPTPIADFAAQADLSIGYACDIRKGRRSPSVRMAIEIFRRTGERFGPLIGASNDMIDHLDAVTPPGKTREQRRAA
jgi:hypothetical protein